MISLEIEEKNILIEAPECWDEMSLPQVKYCLKLASLMLAGKITENKFMLKAFYCLADIKRDFKTIIWERLVSEEKLLAKNANAWMLSKQLTAFMFKEHKNEETGEVQKEFNYETLFNFFSEFKIGRTKFYGPQTLLMDITFAEFRASIEELNTYFITKEHHQLSKLLAVVYRPQRKKLKKEKNKPDFDGRLKVEFNRNNISKHAKLIDKLPEWQRMAMLLHYTYCINYIKTEDLEIEGRTINFSPLFPKPKEGDEQPGKPSIGWTGVLYGVAEKGIFGKVKETDETNFFDVLLMLYDNYLQNEALKEKYRKK